MKMAEVPMNLLTVPQGWYVAYATSADLRFSYGLPKLINEYYHVEYKMENVSVGDAILSGNLISLFVKQKETDKSESSENTNKYEETVQLLTSVIADKFKETVHNKPWIKEPIMYVQRENTTSKENSGNDASKEGTCIHILVDSSRSKMTNSSLYIRGIMMPTSFAQQKNQNTTEFPLSNTVCEELINLAVIFACRNVQDPRLATVVQTKPLEA